MALGLGWPDVSRETRPVAGPHRLGWPEEGLREQEMLEGERPHGKTVVTSEAASQRTTTGVSSDSQQAPAASEQAPAASEQVPAARGAQSSGDELGNELSARPEPGRELIREPNEALEALRATLKITAEDLAITSGQTRVFSVANQKGGVGKTSTAVNLAMALRLLGHRVLVVDMDPQGNASTAFDVDHGPGTPSVYDVLVNGKSLADVVQPSDFPGLLVVPATVDLAGAEVELVSELGRETRLGNALRQYLSEQEEGGERFDFVFVDCPPSLGLLTVNALTAVKEVLVPLQCEYYALEGLGQLLKSVSLVREHLNPELRITGVLLTMFDGRTKLAPQVVRDAREHLPELVLDTLVPRSVRVSEAPSHGKTVLSYDPRSSGAQAYLGVARELRMRELSTGDPQ